MPCFILLQSSETDEGALRNHHTLAVPDAGAQLVDLLAVPDAGVQLVDLLNVPDAGVQLVDSLAVPDAGVQLVDSLNVPDAGAQLVDLLNVPDAGAQLVDSLNVPDEQDAVHEARIGCVVQPRKRKPKNAGGLSPMARKKLKLEKVIAEHGVKKPCLNSCKRKCTSKVTEAHRVKLNSEFWAMSKEEQKMFIATICKRAPVDRFTTGQQSKRTKTFHYFFGNEEGVAVSICKTFFLTTLGYAKNNDTVVQNILHNMQEGSIRPKPSMRGKAPAKNKIDRVIIRNHINSYHPSISHYRREHAPNRFYLPSDITVESMHKDFVENNGAICSYDLYRKVVKEMRISFTKLGHEECESCEEFKRHDRLHTENNIVPTCEICKKWSVHIKRANCSRDEYRKDTELQNSRAKSGDHESLNNNPVFSADLQKVIMLPRLESFKTVVFTRRIVIFNESFVPVGTEVPLKPYAVLWHEGVSGGKKEDIASAFHSFFLQNRDSRSIKLWVDNCSAQNKNWALFTFLVYIINSDEISANEIVINYFEPGHTFMAADNFHHQVELSMKHVGKIYDFDDFVKCVGKSNSGKVDTKSMSHSDFRVWPDLSSKYKLSHTEPCPYLSDMVSVKVVRGKKTFLYKNEFDGPEFELNFLLAKHMTVDIQLPIHRNQPRGISQEKKDDILSKLGRLMPSNRLVFWNNIPVSDVPDLTVAD